jgi:hypothetical protein
MVNTKKQVRTCMRPVQGSPLRSNITRHTRASLYK